MAVTIQTFAAMKFRRFADQRLASIQVQSETV